ncbi:MULTISPECIES: ribosomal protein S18-alanine N-acetyltransferase [Priestia]|jgi:ribosomal-protein-alanine N-acetyltransferase|uniref:ribosomal protein S18-alanine N-acetyltransferase n=1 Tax=Priestia TaxID=2800373 RepID=UPI00048AC620|nr:MULTISPECIES: ribosomal protein S18-alanine N-acetyltransferase [Priestia]KWU58485.1 ribosomal-protein-alanine acetyltransferase [Priestia megaterium]MBX9998151.1 ribosomal protein S18-alanine N-acetyltransferase [Priestia aryabhattai]MCM3155768.1 ribosomal protein S18-alanine N-acetyltransferase [Priestia megaterium]MCP1449618.1 ribosomal-protein-alanine N-acetyltransferase [Priestia megaterium]MCU7740992.1 ribosomal protein S18-alanine N-acetyltransferase [Priestia megaterium]
MKLTIKFRLMEVKDVDQVVKIEEKSFTTPWSSEAFQNELTNNQFSTYIVMEEGENIIGYCGTWIVIDEAHVTNIALLPDYRGKGLGELLLRNVMDVLRKLGATSMTLEVRVSNHIAQSLYQKLGFKPGGIRKNYYSDNNEDALVMWVNL